MSSFREAREEAGAELELSSGVQAGAAVEGASRFEALGRDAGAGLEARLERARAHAWRALNRRDRTVAEVRRLLADKEVGAEAAEVVVGELLAGGYLDDAGFAARFLEDRARLDGWGAGRVERRLLELGVDPDLVAETLSRQDLGAELERALTVLRRRFPVPPVERRDRDRALGVLLRKGYGYEPALAALRRHAVETSIADGPR